jgi:hypothetical protein
VTDAANRQELLNTNAVTAEHPYVNEKLPDAECWARAGMHLLALLGMEPDDLRWDATHHLEGHAHVGGRELVVIASRDELHHALVFTPEDWDELRLSPAARRAEMLQCCEIADHARLVQILAA